MRDFSWRYFMVTGEIDAYLLYKEYEKLDNKMQNEFVELQEEVAAAEE